MTHTKRREVQAYLDVEKCRTAIGTLPIERNPTEDSGCYISDEYGCRLIEKHEWGEELVLVWVCIPKDLWALLLLSTASADKTNFSVQFDEYWWTRHLLEPTFQFLEGGTPEFRQDTQREVTMAIDQLLDVSMAKNRSS